MSKRYISAIATASVFVVALAGCTSSTQPAAEGGEQVIKVWSWQTTQADQWDLVFDAFEKENPGVTVEFTGYPGTEYPTVLATGLSATKGPDIAMLHPYSAMHNYVAAEQLVAIDDTIVPDLASSFTDEALGASRVDDVQYGVPFAQQAIVIYYDKGLFAELGVEPPASIDDWEPLLETISASGVVPIAISGKDASGLPMPFDALVGNTYGGANFIAKAQEGDVDWDNKNFIAALDEFKALSTYFPEQVGGVAATDALAMLASGDAAMYAAGSWDLSPLRDLAPDKDYGVFTLPAPGQESEANPVWGYEEGSFAMSARADNPDGAEKLLAWMATPEFGQLFTDTLNQPSSVIGVTGSDPLLQEIIEMYQANPVPMIWVTDYFGVTAPAPYAALMNGAQALLLGASDSAAVAADIQANVVEWEAR
ncbi:ABC transporter substrate-binding protein [Microbacterium sp. W4I20]|uniref:ABC transporter substrate-binding protein n=1 Tax=Microbacterium sp. W4I20 TaxID=3042262 RepID=UPI0027855D01|nr:extracellular solute-binding protein [Microbacterium sp. W4I20]MDQ0726713.1 raffinose/stachyose/melibiose transport system substrate-binding protein [Microbacterium sp. W4I20]